MNKTTLKYTKTRCPQCHKPCPGEVVREGDQVFMLRTCPEHGAVRSVLASDARFYWTSLGSSENRPSGQGCGCGPGQCRSAGSDKLFELGRNSQGGLGTNKKEVFETLSTCLALIEIVNSCNLPCPTCYADSPLGSGARTSYVPLADLKGRIQGVIDRKGGIEILQLSGGEPTLHPQLLELCQWAKDHPKIDYLLLNTNGLLLAKDTVLTTALGEIFATGGLQIYLQYDGPQEAGHVALRGSDLREIKSRALENLAAAGLPATLAMTVTEANFPHLWETVQFGLASPFIHGITFQPVFGSGRAQAAPAAPPPLNINAAGVVVGLIHQSGGLLGEADFTPLPCGDPNCAIMGYLIRHGGQMYRLSDFIDFGKLQGFLHDRVQYTLEDLAKCGCENEPLGDLLKNLEISSSSTFRLMVKPFMDAWTWDDDRIDRCCTHVIRPDGKLDSFCRYYSGFAQ